MTVSNLLPRIAAGIVLVLSAAVLFGWQTDNEPLKRVLTGLNPGNPYSSVFLFLYALLLMWDSFDRSSRTAKILRILVVIGTTVFALANLSRFYFGHDFHLDQTLFATKITLTNRMSVNTTFCFLLTGLIFTSQIIRYRFTRIIAQITALFILILATQGLINSLFNLTSLFKTRLPTLLAAPVAFSFVLLIIGILVVRDDFGINIFVRNLVSKRKLNLKTNISLIISLIVLMLIGFFSYIRTEQLNDASSAVTGNLTQLKLRTRLIDDLLNAESALRGYVITGDTSYLGPYVAGIFDYTVTYQLLLRDVSKPENSSRLKQVDTLAQEQLTQMANLLTIRRSKGGFDEAKALISSNTGKNLTDQMRTIIDAVDEDEQKDLKTASEFNTQATERTLAVILVGSILGLLVIIAAIIFINRDLRQRKD